MADNPFDQFDPPPQAAVPSGTSNPFDQFDPPTDGSSSILSSLAPQKPDPKSVGSLIESPFVGFNSALANIAGAPADAFNWARGKLGGTPVDDPLGGSKMIKEGMGLIGANPDDRPATTTAERIGQAIGSGAASAVLPEAAVGGLTRMGAATVAPRLADLAGQAFGTADRTGQVVGNAAIGGASGAAGQAAEEAAPDGYKPLAQFAGSLAGGVGAAATGSAIGAAVRPALAGAADYVRPLNIVRGNAADRAAANGVAPGYTPNQVDMARQAVVDAIKPDDDTGVSMNPQSKFDTVNQLADSSPSPIPNYVATPFQTTGNQGLGALEQRITQSDPNARENFLENRAAQNNALVQHIQDQQPTGNAMDVPALFNAQLSALDKASQAGVDALRGDANTAASGVGGAGTAAEAGSDLRGNLSGARSVIDEHEDRLWGAIPKDLAVGMAPIQDSANTAYNGLSKTAQSKITPDETRIQGLIKSFNSVEPFQELQDLRSDILETIRNDKASPTPNPPAQRRLSTVLDGVNETIGNGLGAQATRDQNAVAAGAMAPQDTVAAKLQAIKSPWDEQSGGTANASGASARTGTDPGGLSPMGSPSAPGSMGAGRDPAVQPGQASSHPANAEAPLADDTAVTRRPSRPTVPQPQDLHDFVRSAGGMQDRNGDLASMGLNRLIAKPGQGLGPDAMRQAAAQAGYLGGDIDHAMANTDVNDLLNAVGSDNPVHSVHDADAAAAWDNYRQQRAEYDKVSGPVSKPAMPPKAPLSAYSQEDAYPPGMAPSAAPIGQKLVQNFTPDDLAKMKAASSMTAYKKGTYDDTRTPIGQVLRSSGRAGDYALMDAQVPDKLFTARPGGEQIARDYIAASRGQSPNARYSAQDAAAGDMRQAAAIKDLENAAAVKYRKEAMPNGVVDQAKHDAFMGKYAEPLRAIPDAANRFGTAAAAEQRVAELTAARKDALDKLQQGAFGKVMGNNDPVQGLGQILGQSDRVAQVRQLADRVKGNDDAQMGLRKAFVDLIDRRFMTNTEAGTSGQDILSSDKFQTFMRQNRSALLEVFNKDEVRNLENVAGALKERNRSTNALKLPGGSDTTQKLFPLLKAELEKSHESTGSQAGKVAVPALLAGGLGGAATAVGSVIGKAVLGKARDAGISKVQDLVKASMLNPDLMKALMNRVPIAPGRGSEITLAHQLSRVGMISAGRADQPAAQ